MRCKTNIGLVQPLKITKIILKVIIVVISFETQVSHQLIRQRADAKVVRQHRKLIRKEWAVTL